MAQRSLLSAALVLLLAGCQAGDDHHHDDHCADDPRADAYAANLVKDGSRGVYRFKLLESDPAPPAKGDNTWRLQLLDRAGSLVPGATLKLTPYMPDHGHGTPKSAVVTPASPEGTYTATPVNLFMPGLWEVTIEAQRGQDRDSAVFRFCIAG
ncbi:MAG: FixH family protein [Myxococcales bacterium]|nr:FixH family protein [Myxococcota bacterium]MDW8280289.1 FixH family protein [Myxococcales bacterium]